MIEAEHHTAPARRLGLRPSDPANLARMIRLPLTAAPVGYPPAWDDISPIRTWCLGANNRFGTCGPTSIANYVILLYRVLTGEQVTVTDHAVFDLYRASGNPGFDPATGAGDNGVDMTVMLKALLRQGIEILHEDGTAETIRPYCYAAVPQALTDLYAVTANLGGVILAATLAVAQQAQTDAGLWDYVSRSGIWGGHAFLGGAYTGSHVAHTADETVITWQEPVGASDSFITRQVQEAYVPVFPVLWTSPGFQAGVNGRALADAYTAITGQPWGGPAPAPPPPAPAGFTADAADQALAAVALPWAGQYRSRPDLVALQAAVGRWQAAKGL